MSNLLKGVLALASFGLAAKLLQRSGKLAASSVETFAPLAPVSVSAQEKAVFTEAAAIMREACKAELGREPSDSELTYCLAIAKLETGFGRGWKGAMVGSNNWGAVQCSSSAQGSGGSCIPYEDSYADGTRYKIDFRSYPTPLDGARDVVKHVMVHRPSVAKILGADDCTIYRASLAMRRTTYYGGFCPKTVARYGTMGKRTAQRDPQTDAEKSCEHEAVELHAKTVVAPIAAKISSALGLQPMRLGTFEDAMQALYGVETTPIAGTLSALDRLDNQREELTWFA